jgi:hypothetical protein
MLAHGCNSRTTRPPSNAATATRIAVSGRTLHYTLRSLSRIHLPESKEWLLYRETGPARRWSTWAAGFCRRLNVLADIDTMLLESPRPLLHPGYDQDVEELTEQTKFVGVAN